MNFKTTIALLALLVIVAAVFVANEVMRTGEDGEGNDSNSTGQLFSKPQFEADRTEHITINTGGESTIIERDGAGWSQRTPINFPLDTTAIERLLETVESLATVKQLELSDASPLKEYGLDKPSASITFVLRSLQDDGSRKTLKLALGSRLRDGRGFVRIDDEPDVYLAEGALHRALLDSDMKQWRSRSFSAFDLPPASAAASLALERVSEQVLLTRDTRGWRFAGRGKGRADSQRVEQYLNILRHIVINEFIVDRPDDLATFGLSQPMLRVTVAAAADTAASAGAGTSPRSFTLAIGAAVATDPALHYATLMRKGGRPDTVFTVKRFYVDRLAVAADAFRDPHFSALRADDVQRVEVNGGSAPAFTLDRQEGVWRFSTPQLSYSPDRTSVVEAIEAITTTKAKQFLHDRRPDAQSAAVLRTIVLHSLPGQPVESLHVYPHEKTTSPDNRASALLDRPIVVYRNDETVGHIVEHEALALWLGSPLAFRSTQVLSLSEQAVEQIMVDRPGEASLQFSRTFDKQGDPSPWQLKGEADHEGQALRELLKQLTWLKADKWLPADQSVGSPAIRITIVDRDDRRITLTVNPQTRAATLGDIDGVFTIPDETMAVLQAEFRHRSIVPLNASQVSGIVVKPTDGETIELPIVAGRVQLPVGSGIDANAATALLDAVAPLRVARYVPSRPTGRVLRTITLTPSRGESITVKIALDPTPREDGRTPAYALVGDRTGLLDPKVAGKLLVKLTR